MFGNIDCTFQFIENIVPLRLKLNTKIGFKPIPEGGGTNILIQSFNIFVEQNYFGSNFFLVVGIPRWGKGGAGRHLTHYSQFQNFLNLLRKKEGLQKDIGTDVIF